MLIVSVLFVLVWIYLCLLVYFSLVGMLFIGCFWIKGCVCFVGVLLWYVG